MAWMRDRKHAGFLEGGWRAQILFSPQNNCLARNHRGPSNVPSLSRLPDCVWGLKKPSSVYVGIASADEISGHFYHVQKLQVSLLLTVLENFWPCQGRMLCGHFKQLKTPFCPQTPTECGSPLWGTMPASQWLQKTVEGTFQNPQDVRHL